MVVELEGLVAQPYVLSASGGLIREMSGKSDYKKSCDGERILLFYGVE
jgi:hypothetical protein